MFAYACTQSGMCVQYCGFLFLFFFSFFFFLISLWWSFSGDQIILCVHTGGMPAPEQSPVTEEGLLLTVCDSSTGRNMEADNTANNILASVKEQVVCLLCLLY